MLQLQVCVADGDAGARNLLSRVARAMSGCTVVCECDNGVAALEAYQRIKPNVIVADARLTGIDGFSLLLRAGIGVDTAFVITTADERDGMRAFTGGVVDCVGKPLDVARCQLALRRARTHLIRAGIERLGQRAASLLDDGVSVADAPPRSAFLARLSIPAGQRSAVIPVSSIEWIGAEDCYSRVFAESGSYLLRRTLGVLERQLDPSEFLRTHRSAVVNARRIRGIERRGPNEISLLLQSGATVPVGQRRRAAVTQWLNRLGFTD